MLPVKMTLAEFVATSTSESNNLPLIPDLGELKLIRKGLRKRSVPDVSLLPTEFDYGTAGKFQKITINDELSFNWKTPNDKAKMCLFSNLCFDAAYELDRLELGWMIANFAKIDGLTYLNKLRPISYEDYHQNQFNKLYAKQTKHFQKIENDWRHWAIVPAGHMLFATFRIALDE